MYKFNKTDYRIFALHPNALRLKKKERRCKNNFKVLFFSYLYVIILVWQIGPVVECPATDREVVGSNPGGGRDWTSCLYHATQRARVLV